VPIGECIQNIPGTPVVFQARMTYTCVAY
jgi:hypothetical protein